MARFVDELSRTHTCGQLRLSDADSEVVLMGWVQRQRDRGGVVFVDLRDREGITQITFDRAVDEKAFVQAQRLRQLSDCLFNCFGKSASQPFSALAEGLQVGPRDGAMAPGI